MIKTYVGPMHSAKTASLLIKYNKIWNKEHIICFKPKSDTRDPGVLKSKDFEETVPAICIEDLSEILNYVSDKTRIIFLDEAQWFKGNVGVLNYLSIVCDIDIFIAGLNMTSEQQPFGIIPEILAISDETHNVKASCNDCGRDAPLTYYNGKKDVDTLVGDEGYVPLCPACLLKRETVESLKLRFLKKK